MNTTGDGFRFALPILQDSPHELSRLVLSGPFRPAPNLWLPSGSYDALQWQTISGGDPEARTEPQSADRADLTAPISSADAYRRNEVGSLSTGALHEDNSHEHRIGPQEPRRCAKRPTPLFASMAARAVEPRRRPVARMASARAQPRGTRDDERMLRDIGVTRADVYRETSKPFWRQ